MELISSKPVQLSEPSTPLCGGLVPNSLRLTIAANLANRVAEDQYHLDVGTLGAKAAVNARSENEKATLRLPANAGVRILNNKNTARKNGVYTLEAGVYSFEVVLPV